MSELTLEETQTRNTRRSYVPMIGYEESIDMKWLKKNAKRKLRLYLSHTIITFILYLSHIIICGKYG